ELVQHNFRVGSATLEEVLGWAYPPRRVLSLFIPDFFGNPTHHTYFDLFTWRTVPATVNAEGQPINTIYWGVKNYVEGASYVGLLPVVLAGVALLRQRWHKVLFFAWLSVLSLLFVFGSPLYILVYKLPGLSQVHSPFRWIYPYTLCMALLAGMGLDALSQGRQGGGRWARLVAWLTERALPVAIIVCSVQVLLALGISLALKERIAPLAERALRELALASTAYADWRMLYSCWFRNLSVFGVVGLLSGLALALRGRLARRRVWTALVCLVVVGELFFYGYGFFPAADPALIGLRTPAIDLLTSDPELYRITSYVGDEKPFNANAGMFYDIADARGYDSIILKQYAEYMGGIQYQNELPYNRIAPIDVPHTYALDSPLLDGLNVKYVLAQRDRPIARQGYTLVYDGEILIYRNDDYLPRAYLAPRATLLTDRQELLRALRLHDPRESVLLEEPWAGAYPDETSPGFAHEVEAIEYRPNRVRVIVDTPEPAFLVLADNHFQGWEARIYAMEGAMPAARGEKAKIYRANGTFRAVEVPARRSMVQFAFRPQALVVGLAVSAAGLIGLLILTVARLATRRMEARQ
ncbi:MAG: YfhO family protein, partial [Chloroflexi bacterium]|nr:YfhO family protein [Chloroflexota bacterium]